MFACLSLYKMQAGSFKRTSLFMFIRNLHLHFIPNRPLDRKMIKSMNISFGIALQNNPVKAKARLLYS